MFPFDFYLAVFTGRVLQSLLRLIGKSAGGTWPGEIALILCPNFISCLNPKSFRLIVVAGTNGKTTSGKMIQTILSKILLRSGSMKPEQIL